MMTWSAILAGLLDLMEQQRLYHDQSWPRGDTFGIMGVLWFIVAAILSLRNKA